ncbi:hypothetical protein F5Y14DRAFT_420990 [Nemania sp. NC0429]|nr:hypothetical protein F5Y14DRAFT_420990 [Nemania sp. NC0429]
MSSKNRHDKRKRMRRAGSGAGLDPEPDDSTDTGRKPEEPTARRRQASVYDAVAGRVTTTVPLHSHHESQRLRARHHKPLDPSSRRNPTLSPEEVLFRRLGAPVRYAEKDIYQAHEDLPDGGRGILPDSDLLKSIHSYASRFYGDLPANKQTTGGATGKGVSEQSMDETALLAFGILLEEASCEVLGEDGDLVFTEGLTEGNLGGAHSEDEDDEEVFGFKDAPRYEARGRLNHPRADGNECR